MRWDELDREVDALAKLVKNKPDIVVAIVRGGLVPARLLSSRLGVKEMYCLTVKKVDDGRKVTSEITEDLTDKEALLVEDMLETGKSLMVAREYLESRGAIIKTACLFTMPNTEFRPDYFLREEAEVISFPWE